jgi:hypothetical protein
MIMKSKFNLAALALAGLSILSCQKFESGENSNTSDQNLSSNLMAVVADVATTQAGNACTEDIQSFSLVNFSHRHGNDIYNIPGMNMKFMVPKVSSCATVTVSDSTYPQTILIDYGTGCTNSRGQFKTGKIIMEVSDSFVVSGSVKTIKTEGFSIDSTTVELQATVENLGKNSDGNWVIASNYKQKTTTASGNVVVENYSDTTVWTSGFETVDKTDDIYYKSGSGNKTVNDTIKYSHVIISPLLIDKSCGYIKSGIVEMTRNTDIININYGDGTCDSAATITTNGTSETINLSSLKFKQGGRFGKHNGGKHGEGHKGCGF